MSQTTQIELEPKDCVFLVNYIGYMQFTPQLFSTVSSPTRLGRLARPTVTSANLHQTKYEVNNPKCKQFLLCGQLLSSVWGRLHMLRLDSYVYYGYQSIHRCLPLKKLQAVRVNDIPFLSTLLPSNFGKRMTISTYTNYLTLRWIHDGRPKPFHLQLNYSSMVLAVSL